MKEYTITIEIRGTRAVKYIDVEAENEKIAENLAISYAKTMCTFIATNVVEIKK